MIPKPWLKRGVLPRLAPPLPSFKLPNPSLDLLWSSRVDGPIKCWDVLSSVSEYCMLPCIGMLSSSDTSGLETVDMDAGGGGSTGRNVGCILESDVSCNLSGSESGEPEDSGDLGPSEGGRTDAVDVAPAGTYVGGMCSSGSDSCSGLALKRGIKCSSLSFSIWKNKTIQVIY